MKARVAEPWVEAPLQRFVDDARVLFALLLHPSGQVLGQFGFTRAVDVMAACALGAAIHASAGQLGRELDGHPFRELYHAGRDRQIYIAEAPTARGSLVLLTAFDTESSLGLVQIYFRALRDALASATPPMEESGPALDANFEHDLNRSLAVLFGRVQPPVSGDVGEPPPPPPVPQPESPVPLVNYATREITCKIVYYGPGRSGKTTNLHYIYEQVPNDRKGRMVSLATQTDRTLFFDFLPLDLGSISGFATRFQLYTVPGQVYYQSTRKLVLQGADGVVFVADSQQRQLEENIESMQDLHANLAEHGMDVRTIPLVLQYNKQDLPAELVLPTHALDDALNFRAVPAFPAGALHGTGVFETLRGISELVLRRLSTAATPAAQTAQAGSR